MNVSYDLKMTLAVGNELGEGVSWRSSDQTLWWTDIIGKTLYELPWGENKPKEYKLPLRLCTFGFVQSRDDVLIAAFENGFSYFWPKNGKIEWIIQPDELELGCGRRMNDGRVGPDGAFWVGSMLERESVPGGYEQTGLYRLDPSGVVKFIHGGLHICNGICWSPAGDKMFLADSPKSLIMQTDFDPLTGQCGMFKTFAKTQNGSPDGAITDSKGRYWAALWGGHGISVFDTEGMHKFKVTVPVPQPTIPVFAGPDLNHLVITSARQDLTDAQKEKFPESGNVFIYETNVTGLPPNYFKVMDNIPR